MVFSGQPVLLFPYFGATDRQSYHQAALQMSTSNLTTLDRGWAIGVRAETLGRMQSECLAADQSGRWQVFHDRLLRPLFGSEEPIGYERLVVALRLPSQSVATNMLVNAKRQFSRTVTVVLAAHASGVQPSAEDGDPCAWLSEIVTELLLGHREVLETMVRQMSELCPGTTGHQSDAGAVRRVPPNQWQHMQHGLDLMTKLVTTSSDHQDRRHPNSLEQAAARQDNATARPILLYDLFAEPLQG